AHQDRVERTDVDAELESRRAHERVDRFALAFEQPLDSLAIFRWHLRRVLAWPNHLDVAVEQRQVVVVSTLLLECERTVAAPGKAAIERRRPWLGTPTLPAAPDATVRGNADFVAVDLIRAW